MTTDDYGLLYNLVIDGAVKRAARGDRTVLDDVPRLMQGLSHALRPDEADAWHRGIIANPATGPRPAAVDPAKVLLSYPREGVR